MCTGLHVKCPYSYKILIILELCRQILKKILKYKISFTLFLGSLCDCLKSSGVGAGNPVLFLDTLTSAYYVTSKEVPKFECR